jgi:hypothetical protein
MALDLAFCNGCGYSVRYGKTYSPNVGVSQNIPKPEFCPKCAARMLYGCPNCGEPRETMADKFCKKCGRPYK